MVRPLPRTLRIPIHFYWIELKPNFNKFIFKFIDYSCLFFEFFVQHGDAIHRSDFADCKHIERGTMERGAKG